jgi:hypothetical protein
LFFYKIWLVSSTAIIGKLTFWRILIVYPWNSIARLDDIQHVLRGFQDIPPEREVSFSTNASGNFRVGREILIGYSELMAADGWM